MIKEAQDFQTTLAKHLIIDDWQGVTILMAVAATHKAKANMLWLRLIGASGTGKTEVLRTLLSQNDYCTPGETFTPAALRRGYHPKGEELPRMLERWNGKLVITKDFAPMLTKKSEDRTEVFGLLRSVWDGTLDADYGSEEGHIHQEAWFDWILGTTPYIEHQRSLDAQLGSRFIDLHWQQPKDYQATVKRAIANDPQLHAIQKELADSMGKFLGAVNIEEGNLNLDYTWIADIARLTCVARTVVNRDIHQDVVDLPEAEMPTRLSQGLARIVKGLYAMGIEEYRPYLVRLALDSIPSKRRVTILGLYQGMTQEQIAKEAKVSPPVISTVMSDLRLLGFSKAMLNLLEGGELE